MNEFLHAFILTDSCNIVQMYYLCSHGNSMKNGLRKHVVESPVRVMALLQRVSILECGKINHFRECLCKMHECVFVGESLLCIQKKKRKEKKRKEKKRKEKKRTEKKRKEKKRKKMESVYFVKHDGGRLHQAYGMLLCVCNQSE